MSDLEFFEAERDRYWGIREAAWKFLKEHEQDKGTEAYNLIWQTFVLATERMNDAIFEIERLKNFER